MIKYRSCMDKGRIKVITFNQIQLRHNYDPVLNNSFCTEDELGDYNYVWRRYCDQTFISYYPTRKIQKYIFLWNVKKGSSHLWTNHQMWVPISWCHLFDVAAKLLVSDRDGVLMQTVLLVYLYVPTDSGLHQ